MRTGVWWGKGTVGELGLFRRIILKWNLNRVLDRGLGLCGSRLQQLAGCSEKGN